MQFLVIARDGKDPQALERRMAARPAHLKLGDEMIARGEMHYGVALLGEEGALKGQMIGSVMHMEFPDRAALDRWLAVEPYVTGKVWDTIEVHSCRSGPAFAKKAPIQTGPFHA